MNQHQLEQRLRDDAQDWDPDPHQGLPHAPRILARIATATRSTPRPRWRALRIVGITVAATAVLGLGCHYALRGMFGVAPAPPEFGRVAQITTDLSDARYVSAALAPLHHEIDAISTDAQALADGIWRRLPTAVRTALSRTE